MFALVTKENSKSKNFSLRKPKTDGTLRFGYESFKMTAAVKTMAPPEAGRKTREKP